MIIERQDGILNSEENRIVKEMHARVHESGQQIAKLLTNHEINDSMYLITNICVDLVAKFLPESEIDGFLHMMRRAINEKRTNHGN